MTTLLSLMVNYTGKKSLNYVSRKQLLQCLSEKKIQFQNKLQKMVPMTLF